MINKAARDDMVEAGMPPQQVAAVASHIPDWSRFATKEDLVRLEKSLANLRHDLTWRMVMVMAFPVVLLLIDRFLSG